MKQKVKFKVCCIQNIHEAKLAINYGASAIGLVSAMPSGPGVIEDKLIKQIAAAVPPHIATVLLTSKTSVNEIVLQQKMLCANSIQICDRITDGSLSNLKKELPGIFIMQVIHVTGEVSVSEAITASEYVDALLLDSGNQTLPIKQLGGTGKVHNWLYSKKIVESVTIPVYLAGGLNAGNVADAINIVQPFGVDVCSGIRTNGLLDEKKLSAFAVEVEKQKSDN
ncbi:MAG: phosphoribosylanthranilate isomerase [Ignavibacteriaceae bacterium]|nr:phosphoribosylanthranilate isomerase [Ignavibacteriaceae bacterium]